MTEYKLDENSLCLRRLLMSVLWPAFIMAAISTGVFFGLVSPEAITFNGNSVELSNIVLYSIAFFIFWLLGAIASALTALLMCKSR
jgi:hypothetical protein